MTNFAWTETARVLAKAGKSYDEIQEALEAAGCPTESALRSLSRCRYEGLLPPHQFRQTFRSQGITFVSPETQAEHAPALYEQQQQLKAQRATLEHLLDLKRAGHSPRFTELNIPTDLDRPRRYHSVVEVSSYLGSSGAMCAELGK